jgi:hypothetical protein
MPANFPDGFTVLGRFHLAGEISGDAITLARAGPESPRARVAIGPEACGLVKGFTSLVKRREGPGGP